MSFGLLKKSEPEKVQRRSHESSLRRVQPRQEMDKEELDYYSRSSRASVQSRRRPRDEEGKIHMANLGSEEEVENTNRVRGGRNNNLDMQTLMEEMRRMIREERVSFNERMDTLQESINQRRLRQIREEQSVSKPKVFAKTYPAAKGKAMVSTLKAQNKEEIKSVQVKGKSETATYRTREVRCCSSASEEEAQETKEAEVVIEPIEAEVVPIKNDVPDLRTNPFQEGGNDMIMESSEKTCVPCSEQTKSMINLSISSATWSTFSPHLEHTSKLNQSNPSSGEEVIQLPSQVIPSLRDSDIRAFNNYFQPNQKESSYETNYSGILNHHRIWENWKHNNAGSDLGDMNFTSQWICFRPYCATEPKIMMHSPTQVRSQRKTNWRILLDLLGFQQAQEQKKWISDHKVIAHFPKWVNMVLYLKNSKPSPIKSLQNHVWHPGTSTKPKGQCMAQNKMSNSWS